MADDYERNKERRAQNTIHSTLETVHIEQNEAKLGHKPGSNAAPPPTLIQRILKALGLRR
ncbi:MAG: hypothetical protein SGJ24_19040 [Chloroflexota bacterium]|nr:hypothetical protein [Chloroflexota bacterium]